MVVTNGKTINLRELKSEEPRISPEDPFNQTAMIHVEKPLRRHGERLGRNPEAYVYYENVFIAEPDYNEVDPSPFSEAIINLDKSKWIKAMESEMDSMR